MMNLISREHAKEINQVWYFTGDLCQNCHLDKRYTNTTVCYACKRLHRKKEYSLHPQIFILKSKKNYIKYRNRYLANSQKWVKNNLDKSREIKSAYKVRHKEKLKVFNQIAAKKRRECPLFRINSAISVQIYKFLTDKKGGRKWESVVGYSFEELKAHLENHFNPNMNWNNYGTYWEIDHIKAKNNFPKHPTDENVKLIWSLSNLQPLECSINRSLQDKEK